MTQPQQEDRGEVVLYELPDGKTSLEVRLEGDTVWLTQAQMAELFKNTKQNISLHTRNIFRERELEETAVVKESLTTASDGKKYRTRYFNLDVIISVGYRVKSKRGVGLFLRNSIPQKSVPKENQTRLMAAMWGADSQSQSAHA